MMSNIQTVGWAKSPGTALDGGHGASAILPTIECGGAPLPTLQQSIDLN
jgi:hypothetical protein